MKEERKKDKHNCVWTHFVLSPCLCICLCVIMCCQRANASYAQRRIQGKLYLYALFFPAQNIHPSIQNYSQFHVDMPDERDVSPCACKRIHVHAHGGAKICHWLLMQVRTHACRRLQTCTDNILRQTNFRQNHLKSSESGISMDIISDDI